MNDFVEKSSANYYVTQVTLVEQAVYSWRIAEKRETVDNDLMPNIFLC
jgi:hypothetical protein